MENIAPFDPYRLRSAGVEAPPQSLGGVFRRIGPGLILASAIVGSGELVASTVLGAENGYKLLWLILLSCVIKTVVQHELGRYTLATGETALEAFDRIPGPRLRVSWVVWLWLMMVIGTVLTMGGMLGGIAEVLHVLAPAVSINIWVWLICLGTVGLLIVGRYNMVERVAMGLVVSFTALTASGMFILFRKPEYFSVDRALDGLLFQPPEGGLLTAVAVFGITGVAASELAMYPYWCLEKGYARFTGPREDSASWRDRAQGWIRVMGVDVAGSFVIYTFATIAFYLLGAGILHGLGVVPQGTEMVMTLSNMYTETLGDWSRGLFLAGAVVVFYSSVFVMSAGHSRMLADLAALLGFFPKRDYAARLRLTRWFVVAYLVPQAISYVYLGEPVMMVKLGGAAEAALLPVIGFAAVYLRHRRLPRAVMPKGWITLALWLTSAAMTLLMGYSVAAQFL